MATYDADSESGDAGNIHDALGFAIADSHHDQQPAAAPPFDRITIASNLHGEIGGNGGNYDVASCEADDTPTISNVNRSEGPRRLAPRSVPISAATYVSESPSLRTEQSSELLFEMGYDSDGFMPELETFFEDFDEVSLPTGPTTTASPAPSLQGQHVA